MARTALSLLAFLLALLASDTVLAAGCGAATSGDNSLDQITALFRNCAQQWETVLGGYALRLFWLLAAIEFAWSAIRLVFRNADINEWLGELVNQVFFLGIFLALLTNATAWTGAIVDSFRMAGAGALQASGVPAGIAPSDIFEVGVNMAAKMIEALSIRAPVQSLFVVLAAFVIIACFAMMAAAIILALVESYVVLSAGVLLMGFGGARWTKDFALKTVIYAVSVGAKLFVLQLIAGLGAQIIGGWANLPESQSVLAPVNATANILIIVGSALVLWVLVKSVPEMIQGLINGTALGVNTGLINGLAQISGSIYALGMAINSSRDLAREQITDAATNPAREAPGLLSRSVANLGGAAVANIGNRLSGRAGAGTRLGQMAAAMDRDAAGIRSAREKQQALDARAQGSGPTPAGGNPPATPAGGGTSPPAPPPTPRPAANTNTPTPRGPNKP